MPLAAHGVGTDRRLTWLRGIRASISDSCSWVRATRPTSCTNAAMPSYVVENCGTTKPPRPSPPKTTPAAGDRLGQRPPAWWRSSGCRRRGRRRPARRPGSWSPGSATVPPCRSAATRSSTTSSARSSSIGAPFSSTSAIRSPTGSKCTPNAALRRRHQPAEPAQRLGALGRGLGRGRLVEPVVDGQDVQAEPAEQGGQHQRRGAAAGVDHDLEAGSSGRPGRVDSCAAARGCRPPSPAAGTTGRRSRPGTRGGTPPRA